MMLSEMKKIIENIIDQEGDIDCKQAGVDRFKKFGEDRTIDIMSIKVFNIGKGKREAVLSANDRKMRDGSEVVYTINGREEI